MRMALNVAACWAVVAILIAVNAQADDAKSNSSTQKTPPSDKDVINMVGNGLLKVFPKFGYPNDVRPSDVTSDEPTVFLDYGSYGFKIRKNVVQTCYFFSAWNKTVYGVKVGDSQDDVLKKLGKPKSTAKNDDGSPYMLWSFKNWDGSLEIDFDKDNKASRAVVGD